LIFLPYFLFLYIRLLRKLHLL